MRGVQNRLEIVVDFMIGVSYSEIKCDRFPYWEVQLKVVQICASTSKDVIAEVFS